MSSSHFAVESAGEAGAKSLAAAAGATVSSSHFAVESAGEAGATVSSSHFAVESAGEANATVSSSHFAVESAGEAGAKSWAAAAGATVSSSRFAVESAQAAGMTAVGDSAFDCAELEATEKNKRLKLESSHHFALFECNDELRAMVDSLSFLETQAASAAAQFLRYHLPDSATGAKLDKLLRAAVASGNTEPSDVVFLEHFLCHIAVPSGPYNELIASVAEHYANLLGMQEYLTLASFLRLPKAAWIKGRRRVIRQLIHIGTMHKQIDLLSMSEGELAATGRPKTCSSLVAMRHVSRQWLRRTWNRTARII